MKCGGYDYFVLEADGTVVIENGQALKGRDTQVENEHGVVAGARAFDSEVGWYITTNTGLQPVYNTPFVIRAINTGRILAIWGPWYPPNIPKDRSQDDPTQELRRCTVCEALHEKRHVYPLPGAGAICYLCWRKKQGLCANCGDTGEWRGMALMCRQGHGKICG